MAIASLAMLISTIFLVRESSRTFTGNLTFYASQVEYEVMQLIDHLDRYSDGEEGVTLDDVLIRFDVLWSRVHINDPLGTFGSEAWGVPMASETIELTKSLLAEAEPQVLRLDRDDAASVSELKTKLRTIVPVAHKLALLAKDDRVRANTAFLQSQLRQAYFTFAFITGMVLFGVLTMAMLFYDRREIKVMNTRLEDRVRERTEDLQMANAQLATEVAERKRNQALAEEREARLEQAVQLAKLGYYVWDAIEDRCEYCSDQHARAHGLTPEEYVEQASHLEGDFSLTHPDDRKRVRQKYRELREGSIVEMDHRVVTPTGFRRIREVARPIFDENGKVIKEIGSTLDVTDQYETEMKLFEAQRMDSIGKLTGGIAHDFNNLLAVILGNLELLREVSELEEREAMIGDAINATLRGRDLTLNMLSFARRAPLDPAEIDLNAIVNGMEGMLRRTLPENIKLEIALPKETWTVSADRSLTESALLNLVINARDAMPTGGNLTIETSNVVLGEEYFDEHAEDIEPGDYVMMAVTDTGGGIDPQVLPHVFDPFFTTKAVAKNSGLGLSMVQGFIRQTGGAIRVYSEPGIGTTFKLFFKSVSARKEEPAGKATRAPLAETGAKLLLVEDDNTVRRVLSRQLRQSGYSVVSASESESAEKAFRTDGPFDLVVSDIVMPGDLQGPALARKLREMQQDLPVIFLSGYPQEATIQGNGVSIDDVMLMKPVSRDELLRAVADALKASA
ncbi:MAG: response regulator [Rhodobacter sp.]|nr:response regulator [Rhodobacter sp.]